jgi:hypothetical protein
MSNVLKVKIAGQRIRYEVSKVTFDESDLEAAKGWKWEYNGNTLCFCENKLDILRDYDTFDCVEAGVAIRPSSDEITYEFKNSNGKISMDNVLLCVNHRILFTYRQAKYEDGLTLLDANEYDKKNTIYEYTLEVGDNKSFDASLLEIVSIRCPITEQEHIVEMRYNGEKMKGGADGLPFRKPVSKKSMLTVPKDYADALGLVENWKLDKILRFEDFIKEEDLKLGKEPFNKVKSFKEISEDYIHSFIDEHEPDHEIDEEE